EEELVPAKYAQNSCTNYPDPGNIIDRSRTEFSTFVFYKEGIITSPTLLDGIYIARNNSPINIFLRQEVGNGSKEAIIKIYSNINGLIGTIDTSNMTFINGNTGKSIYYFNPRYIPNIGEEITVECTPQGLIVDYKLELLIGVYGVEVDLTGNNPGPIVSGVAGLFGTQLLNYTLPFNSYFWGVTHGNISYSINPHYVYPRPGFSDAADSMSYTLNEFSFLYSNEMKSNQKVVVTTSFNGVRTGKALIFIKQGYTSPITTVPVTGVLDRNSYNLYKEFPIPLPAKYTWTQTDPLGVKVIYDNTRRLWKRPDDSFYYDQNNPPTLSFPTSVTYINDGPVPATPLGTSNTITCSPENGLSYADVFTTAQPSTATFASTGRFIESSANFSSCGNICGIIIGQGFWVGGPYRQGRSNPLGEIVGESLWYLPDQMFLRDNAIEKAETKPSIFSFSSTYPKMPLGDFPDFDFPLPIGGDFFSNSWPTTSLYQLEPLKIYTNIIDFGCSSNPIYTNSTDLALNHNFKSVVFSGDLYFPSVGTQIFGYPFISANIQTNLNGSEGFKLVRHPYPINNTNFKNKYPTQLLGGTPTNELSYAYFFAIDLDSFVFNEPAEPLSNWRTLRITPFIGEYEYSYSRTIGEYGICNSEQDPDRFWFGIKLGAYEPVAIDVGDNLYSSFGNVRRFGTSIFGQNEDWIAPRYNITQGSGLIGVQGNTISKPIPTPPGVYTYEPFITGSEPIPSELTPAQLAFKDTHTVLLDGTAISCEPIGDLGEAIRLNQPGYVLQRFGRIEEINSILTFVEEKTQIVTLKNIMSEAGHISNQYIEEIEVLTIKASPIRNI
ncbi:MAG: hypothetical protein ACRCU6_04325, partial [Fusobacteriaceae bacterium]